MDLNIETASLDEASKTVLRKLVAAGCSKGGATYVVDQAVASVEEFSSLIQRGYKSIQAGDGGLGFVLFESFDAPNVGQDAGKVRFRLHFDLA